ncbi:prepilin peptidase [Bdellovibrionota bacterium FG-1]
MWVFSALLGLVLGSFLNVVIARLPEGKSVVRPGSACPSCGAPIRWYDNIPLLSFLLLRARCRSCQTPISLRYPLVEFLTALLFVASAQKYGWSVSLFLRDWPLLLILVAVTFIDLDRRIIPDLLSLGGLIWALATSWLDPRMVWFLAPVGAAVGFGLFYLLAWFYLWGAGRWGWGGGDIKLMGMLGAFFGPAGVFCVMLVSSVLGTVVGVSWALVKRDKNPETVMMHLAIPFGPFLVVGGLYYYLLGDWLWLPFTIPT